MFQKILPSNCLDQLRFRTFSVCIPAWWYSISSGITLNPPKNGFVRFSDIISTIKIMVSPLSESKKISRNYASSIILLSGIHRLLCTKIAKVSSNWGSQKSIFKHIFLKIFWKIEMAIAILRLKKYFFLRIKLFCFSR